MNGWSGKCIEIKWINVMAQAITDIRKQMENQTEKYSEDKYSQIDCIFS